MPSTEKSLPLIPVTGTSLQPSAPGAVHPLTLDGQPCSNATLISLVAICSGLMAETLSEDAMFLALARAKREALTMGVDPADYQHVRELILKRWVAQRSRNPLNSLF